MENNADLIVLASPPRRPSRPPALSLDEKIPPTPRISYPLDSSCSTAPEWSPYLDSAPPTGHSYPARTSEFLQHSWNRTPSSTLCCQRLLVSRLRPWLPLVMYAITSLAFVVAIAFYKTQLFQFLDDLSQWLRSDENYGHLVLFSLIFLTTIPPIPLYSTLIVLSGYTFGALTGAVISYFAALTGAVIVFLLSRSLLRDNIDQWLNSLTGIRRAVRAIEKRPKLLFLIRLAPYPYNVMNCLLAASPTLTLQTYTVCTALSLFKVIIHTSIGASIHSFKSYHVSRNSQGTFMDRVTEFWTIIGMTLCISLFVYLSIIARKAIDEELDDTSIPAYPSQERAMTEIP